MNIPENIIFKRMPSAEQVKNRSDELPPDGEDGFIEILEDLPLQGEGDGATRGGSLLAAHLNEANEGEQSLLAGADHEKRAEDKLAGTESGEPTATAVLQMLSSASGFALHQALRPAASVAADGDQVDPRQVKSADAALPTEGDNAATEDALNSMTTRMRLTVLGGETHFAPAAPTAANPGATLAGRKTATGQAAGEAQLSADAFADPDGTGDDTSQLLARSRASDDAQRQMSQEGDGRRSRPDAASVAPLRTARADAVANPQPGATATAQPEGAAAPDQNPAPNGQGGLPASQLGRLASAIADDGLSLTSPETAPTSQAPGSTSAQPTAGPVRTLNLQLDPAGLGTVRIDLRLSRGELSVTLRASQNDTAKMLERDKHALMELLRSSGHSPERLAIHSVHVDGAATQQDSQHSPRGNAQAWTGGQGMGGGAEQGRPSPQQQQQPSPEWGRRQLQQGAEGNAQSSGEGGRGRDLYV